MRYAIALAIAVVVTMVWQVTATSESNIAATDVSASAVAQLNEENRLAGRASFDDENCD